VDGSARHIGVSTPCSGRKLALDGPTPNLRLGPRRELDCERVAHVVRAKRKALLWAYRYMLRREDLEDCFGQASMELIRYVRAGGSFSHTGHAAAALELRFLSRVQDRCRAIAGRSPIQAAAEGALASGSLGDSYTDHADVRCAVEELAMMRLELRLVPVLARKLTPDQRLVLACQVGLQMERREFCELFGWSFAKYRKVAQRARARMRELSEQFDESRLDGDAPMGNPPPLAHRRLPRGPEGRSLTRRPPSEPQPRNGGRGPGNSPLGPSVVEAQRSERAA
jgi:DNA-directed RNA polymerase specialized sigma24 family protein